MTQRQPFQLTRDEFAKLIELVLTGVETTDPERPAGRWRPSGDLNEGVSTIWVAFQDDGIEGLDAVEERLILTMYNHYDDLESPDLTARRRQVLDRLGLAARRLKDHVARRR